MRAAIVVATTANRRVRAGKSVWQRTRMPGCYAVLGYGGNGITFSMLAAQLLRGLISGEGDADEDLFSFHRKF